MPWYALNFGIHWSEPVAFFVLWWLTGFGVTAGYHRLFSHRSYKAPAPVRFVLLVLGAATWQNSAITWSAAHRFHHNDVDTDDDPYNINEGFFHAHMGWVMIDGARHDDLSNVDDLWRDKLCVWQHKYYFPLSLAFNIGVPVLLGLLTGRIVAMLLWAGLLRIVVLHHMTFFINSLAHMWGRRPWNDTHSARDNGFLAFLTLGEGYHNYHHSFPSDYRNGHRWWHFDPTKWLIWSLERVGLARDLTTVPLDRQMRRRWKMLRTRSEHRLDDMSESMKKQWDEATARVEAAFEEVRTVRHRLSRAARDAKDSARKELQSALQEAEASLRRAMREWEARTQQLST